MDAELLADLDGEQPASSQLGAVAPPRRHPRRIALAFGIVTLAASTIVIVAGGASEHPSRAYGAELVRFAESTPLLLLEGPGWRVQNVYEAAGGPYQPRGSGGEGSMEFVTGPAIPYESTTLSADGTVRGMAPKTVRQRKVELTWHHGSLQFPGPTVAHPIKAPVLDTTALVNTRAETAYIETKGRKTLIKSGGPGDREMAAIWQEGGYTLEMRAWVSGLPAFEERLGWLSRVDSQTWLDAMPAKVVKAAEHDAAVREMLKGIPVPKSFRPSQIPDQGLTTNRYQVGASVTGIVSCLWFRQWGEARRTGDHARERRKPKRRWRPRSTGRSSARWRRKVATPSRSGNSRRRCRVGNGHRVDGRCCHTQKAWVAPAGASRSCRGSRDAKTNAPRPPEPHRKWAQLLLKSASTVRPSGSRCSRERRRYQQPGQSRDPRARISRDPGSHHPLRRPQP